MIAASHQVYRKLVSKRNAAEENQRSLWWLIKVSWPGMIMLVRLLVTNCIHHFFPDWIAFDIYSQVFIYWNLTYLGEICLDEAAMAIIVFNILAQGIKPGMKYFDLLQAHYLHPLSIFLSHPSVPPSQIGRFEHEKKKFNLCRPPNRVLKLASDHLPVYFDHNRLTTTVYLHQPRHKFALDLWRKYTTLVLVNTIELGNVVLNMITELTLASFLIGISFAFEFASVCLSILDAILFIVFIIWISPSGFNVVAVGFFIVQFIVMNCSFWTKKIREIMGHNVVNVNAKREMIMYHHQIMHHILLVLDFDNNLMSEIYLIFLAVQFPLSIVIVVELYLRANFPITAHIFYIMILCIQIMYTSLFIWAISKVTQSMYSSEHHLLPFQYRLKTRDVRLKIRVMRMYEILHTHDRVSFSVKFFTRMSRELVGKVFMIYIAYLIMAIPIIEQLIK